MNPVSKTDENNNDDSGVMTTITSSTMMRHSNNSSKGTTITTTNDDPPPAELLQPTTTSSTASQVLHHKRRPSSSSTALLRGPRLLGKKRNTSNQLGFYPQQLDEGLVVSEQQQPKLSNIPDDDDINTNEDEKQVVIIAAPPDSVSGAASPIKYTTTTKPTTTSVAGSILTPGATTTQRTLRGLRKNRGPRSGPPVPASAVSSSTSTTTMRGGLANNNNKPTTMTTSKKKEEHWANSPSEKEEVPHPPPAEKNVVVATQTTRTPRTMVIVGQRGQGTSTTTPSRIANGLSKKTPRARGARAGSVAVSSDGPVPYPDNNQDATLLSNSSSGGGISSSSTISPIRGLSKNQPPASRPQQQQHNIPPLRGLAKNRPPTASSSPEHHHNRPSTVQLRGLRKSTRNNHRLGSYQQQEREAVPDPIVPNNEEMQPPNRSFPSPLVDSLSSPTIKEVAPLTSTNPLPSTTSHQTNLRGDTGLAVARAINGGSMALVEAQEVDAGELERRSIEKKKNKECIIVGIVLIVLSLSILFGVVFGTATTTTEKVDVAPSTVPSSPPSDSPSSAPSGVLDMLFESLPAEMQERICCDTPQYKAWYWLLGYPNITNLEEWRKKQLFALAVLFYSFEGENWYGPIKERWMDYEKEECLWFSSGFGYFGTNGKYRRWDVLNATCNDDGGFTSLNLQDLQLSGFNPTMPPEISLLTSLSTIQLNRNDIYASLSDMLPSEISLLTSLSGINLVENHISGSLPSVLGLLTSLTELLLRDNDLGGSMPSEMGLLTNLTWLHLRDNSLTGQLPCQLGLMTSLEELYLHNNALTGQLPSQLGLMTSVSWLDLLGNAFTGSIPAQLIALFPTTSVRLRRSGNLTLPTEVGLLTNTTELNLRHSSLVGSIPSEIGLMTSLEFLRLSDNTLVGQLQSEQGLMTRLWSLDLKDNALAGSFPSELVSLVLNGSLKVLMLANNSLSGTIPDIRGSPEVLTLANNSFSGTIPENLCSLGVFDASLVNFHYSMAFLGVFEEGLGDYGMGLSFDCSDQLCGCCWCPCPGSNYSMHCQANPIYLNDEEWPGEFPSTANGSNAITLNIRTDRSPYQTSFEWSTLDVSGLWAVLESGSPSQWHWRTVHSYTMEVESDSLYRLQIFDSWGNGIERGWFTITNSTASPNFESGTVIWDATGETLRNPKSMYFREYSFLDAFIWVDSSSHSQLVEYLPGYGYALEGGQAIVVPDTANHTSSINSSVRGANAGSSLRAQTEGVQDHNNIFMHD